MDRKRWPYIAVFCLLIFSWILASAMFHEVKQETPVDVFIRQNTLIDETQRVGRLMAVGGDVAVSGHVEKGIILVDGKLTLLPGAQGKGTTIVLGGSFDRAENVNADAPLLVWEQGEKPVAPILLRGLLLASFFGAMAGIMAVYGLVVWLWHSAWFFPAQTFLLALQRRWPLFYIGLSMGICIVMLLAFSELAWDTVFRHETEAIDGLFIWMVRYFASPSIDKVMIGFSSMGAGLLYALIVLSVLAFFTFKGHWRDAGALMLSFGGGLALNVLLKVFFERSRPELAHVVEAAGYSFPSGHAMVSLCFYGMLAFLLMRRTPSLVARILVAALSVLLIGAIGLSRVYLGVHYPTDVAAGYAAGATWLAFCLSSYLAQERN